MCDHKSIRVWKRKSGWTEKCRNCGMKRHGKTLPPSGFREYMPGTPYIEEGIIRVPLLDVTSISGGTEYTTWF